MKLWLISQMDNTGYDTYDCAVVAAETEEDACNTFPNPAWYNEDVDWYDSRADKEESLMHAWTTPDKVSAQYIGEAAPGTEAGIICSSYNAG